MNDIKSMTVSTVISSITSGQIKVSDLATTYGKADRTIQKYIKSLGYIWSPKEKVYLATGDSYDSVNDSKLFTEIVESYSTVANKKPTKTVTNNSTKRVDGVVDNVNATDISSVDSIDKILFSKSVESQRVQRAYYIDKDIARIIDTVDNKQKSNLVNECLRRIFEEKGLL
ncbi:hypothetical protein J1907_23790 (plasmid) [Lysinibacillus sphaericus]|uniref:LP1G.22 n=1 Tax=Lysinibacillus sphaericus TaxID=1421 RepID=Q7WYL6_LYSSH|nr:hypothetical protein [Lysinibacillus sphaericus]AAP86232.1 LP1G.22 [Lysinibacillus sphaericus]MBG9689949.1 hypothetical protein [Lysinibacillus sphaericus]QTB25020.1 hypothetical protein J1907_23790 [Lysinibacillus sphaericus]